MDYFMAEMRQSDPQNKTPRKLVMTGFLFWLVQTKKNGLASIDDAAIINVFLLGFDFPRNNSVLYPLHMFFRHSAVSLTLSTGKLPV
jgi:hypothetical protein